MPKLGYLNPTKAPSSVPTIKDIAWAAGIYEGEGTCKATHGSFGISVAQKDVWLVPRLRDLFGGAVAKHNFGGVNPDLELYQWTLYGARARGFAQTIYSFLSPRRRAQIRKALGVVEQ